MASSATHPDRGDGDDVIPVRGDLLLVARPRHARRAPRTDTLIDGEIVTDVRRRRECLGAHPLVTTRTGSSQRQELTLPKRTSSRSR